ncbi:hypothetical protein BC938DRAFT_482401 [Jimgerdemannia flammicorona]|uniref:Uncharacterized protein n=1 Tax=Jimgerdemannia flammicorona TaxID=994334 RepID=A0A433QE42_9FUNG|nr:hypothetical protein BC938DRAFT_482401 [Jimgerdemannia flammicorona]
MNSTTTGTSDGNGPPHIAHLLATTIVVWTSVVFNIISCVVIGRKVILKFSRLRFGCFLTSIVVIVQGIVSVQRIWDVVSELSFSLLRSVTLVLFINLMVAITLDLGGKFYVGENRRGALYWATLVATAIINVMFVVAFILLLIPDTLAMGTIIHNASRVSWPVVLLIAYWYAFSPVVKTRLGEKAESQSAVVAVGIW